MNSVVLITIDCLRSDHVHSYGYERPTSPNMDKLADEGILYKKAYSNGPGTRWAFRALNMGVYPLRIDGAGLPPYGGTTLAEVLSDNGYRTAAFVDNAFLTSHFNQDRGFDTFLDTEFFRSEDQPTQKDILQMINDIATGLSNRLSDGLVYDRAKMMYDRFLRTVETRTQQSLSSDPEVVDRATSWIQEASSSDDPYFAWVHLMDAHHPHQYHPNHRESLGISEDSEHVRVPTKVVEPGEDPLQSVVDTYDANLREADRHVGRLLDQIDHDTMVVLTGDHGEEFGLHNSFHSASMYESMSRVPLIISFPELERGRVERAVNHIDIPPTIVRRAAGVDPPDVWDGITLDDFEPPERDIFIGIEWPDHISGAVVRGDWKYHCQVVSPGSIEEEHLYNIADDPHEKEDVQRANPGRLDSLRDSWGNHLEYVVSDRFETEYDVWDPDNQVPERHIREGGESTEESREEMSDTLEERLEHLGYK